MDYQVSADGTSCKVALTLSSNSPKPNQLQLWLTQVSIMILVLSLGMAINLFEAVQKPSETQEIIPLPQTRNSGPLVTLNSIEHSCHDPPRGESPWKS